MAFDFTKQVVVGGLSLPVNQVPQVIGADSSLVTDWFDTSGYVASSQRPGLSAAALTAALLAVLDSLVDSVDRDEIFDSIEQTLDDYIDANCEVSGTYTGTLPNGNPDPLNGTWYWGMFGGYKTTSMKGQAESGWSGFTNALDTGIEATGSELADYAGAVTLSTNVYAQGAVSLSQTGSTSRDDFWAGIIEEVVSQIQGTPLPASMAATSAAGGTGTVSFGSIT